MASSRESSPQIRVAKWYEGPDRKYPHEFRDTTINFVRSVEDKTPQGSFSRCDDWAGSAHFIAYSNERVVGVMYGEKTNEGGEEVLDIGSLLVDPAFDGRKVIESFAAVIADDFSAVSTEVYPFALRRNIPDDRLEARVERRKQALIRMYERVGLQVTEDSDRDGFVTMVWKKDTAS